MKHVRRKGDRSQFLEVISYEVQHFLSYSVLDVRWKYPVPFASFFWSIFCLFACVLSVFHAPWSKRALEKASKNQNITKPWHKGRQIYPLLCCQSLIEFHAMSCRSRKREGDTSLFSSNVYSSKSAYEYFLKWSIFYDNSKDNLLSEWNNSVGLAR